MENKNILNSDDLNEGAEKMKVENTENVEKEGRELTPAEKILQKIAAKKESKLPENEVKTEISKENESAKEISVNQADVTKKSQDAILETIEVKETKKETNQIVTNVVKEATKEEEKKDEKIKFEHKKAEEKIKEEEPDEDFFSFSRESLVNKFKELIDNEPVQNIKKRAEKIKSTFYKKLNDEIEITKKEFLENGGIIEDFKNLDDKLEDAFKNLTKTYKESKDEHLYKIENEKKENQKKKLQIIEELKNLINKPEEFNDTYNEFKDLQKRWREVGLVPSSEVKKLWETYNYHVENFYNYLEINKELRDLDLKVNLAKKIELCEQAEELVISPTIVKAYKELQILHDKWREIGPVSNEKKEEVWERFKSATIQINKNHQDHFESLKQEQDQNLKNKTTLCEKVEELANEEITSHKEWNEKGDMVVEIQKLWRGIGYAPKKYNDEIYTRFRHACDKFFEAKRIFYTSIQGERDNNLQLKTDLCLQAESLQNSTDWKKTSDVYKTLQNDWKKIGQVQGKHSDEIWKRFRKACNKFFENKQKFFKDRHGEEDRNLQAKYDIIKEIETFTFTDKGIEDLNKLKVLQNNWTEIGFVPFDKKDELYKQYREAIAAKFEQLNVDKNQRTEMQFKEKIDTIKGSRKSKELFAGEIEKIQQKIEKIKADVALWENNLGFFANTKNAESMLNDFKNKIERSKESIVELTKQISILRKEDNPKD